MDAAPALDAVTELSGRREDRRVHHRQGAAGSAVRQIAENAGVDGSVVFEKIKNSRKVGFGYNAYSATYCDMVPAGYAQGRRIRCGRAAPDFVQQIVVGQHFAGVLGQHADQLVLNGVR